MWIFDNNERLFPGSPTFEPMQGYGICCGYRNVVALCNQMLWINKKSCVDSNAKSGEVLQQYIL